MAFGSIRKILGMDPGSSRAEVDAEHVWLTREAKLAGIRRALDQRTGEGATLIALVAHFPDVLADLERIAADYQGAASVRAVLARRLTAEAAASLPLGETSVLDLIVAERHPTASTDDALIGFARALPGRARVVYHVSLDDAVLQAFGVESIRTTLERMGATENEAIISAMVSRSIRRAQQKIEARSTGHLDADSAAGWIERNART